MQQAVFQQRGASGALYPQSATAGSNSPSRVCGQQDCRSSGRWWLGPVRRGAVNLVRTGR